MIRAVLLLLALAAGAVPTTAQTTDQTSPAASSSPTFLSGSRFYMGAEHLATESEQFVWEANFGGDVDLVDWRTGRATFFANYQVMMGEELKAFDPNQGNYILGFTGSTRIGASEVAGVFHHESRHLSDRPKVTAVDWNQIGVRLLHRRTAGALSLDTQAQFLGTVQKSHVDYTWELSGRTRGDIALRQGIGAMVIGNLRVIGVDGSRNRSTQTGGRLEGGFRFDGEMGALELFLAVERRVDPLVLEFGTMNWLAVGFRLSSR